MVESVDIYISAMQVITCIETVILSRRCLNTRNTPELKYSAPQVAVVKIGRINFAIRLLIRGIHLCPHVAFIPISKPSRGGELRAEYILVWIGKNVTNSRYIHIYPSLNFPIPVDIGIFIARKLTIPVPRAISVNGVLVPSPEVRVETVARHIGVIRVSLILGHILLPINHHAIIGSGGSRGTANMLEQRQRHASETEAHGKHGDKEAL